MACTKEIEDTPKVHVPEVLEFEASVSGTKTVLADGTEILWCPSDKISVSGATDAFTTDIKENSAAAVFSGKYVESTGGFYYAAYPYGKVVSWNSSRVTISLPDIQNAVAGTFENGFNISVAKCAEDSRSLKFSNVTGLVHFVIDSQSGDIRSVKISAGDKEYLSGEFTVDCSEETLTPVIAEETGRNEIVLQSEDTMSPGDYYVSVIPGTFSDGLEFEFTDGEGNKTVKKYDSARTVESGCVCSVGTVGGLDWDGNQYEGPIVVECENMELGNDAAVIDDDSASEGKAVDLQGNGGTVSAQIQIPEDGVYRIDLRYNTGGTPASDKFNEISVNDEKRMVNFITTNQYEDLNIGVFEFSEGQVSVGIHGYWGWSKCDRITVTKVDGPAQINLDYNDATVGGGAEFESGQIALKTGYVSFRANIPAAGYYKVRINSYNGDGDTKYNRVEIPGIMEGRSCEFIGIGAYQEFVAGTFYCDSAREIELKISAEWGWSYIQNVSIVPVDQEYTYIAECESGLLENGAVIGGPGVEYGKADDQSVSLNTGQITVTANIESSGVYVVKIRHFTWINDEGGKKQNVEIPGILEKKEYQFPGSNSWSDLTVGKVYIPSGNVTTVISTFEGYNYFDRVSFEKVIY